MYAKKVPTKNEMKPQDQPASLSGGHICQTSGLLHGRLCATLKKTRIKKDAARELGKVTPKRVPHSPCLSLQSSLPRSSRLRGNDRESEAAGRSFEEWPSKGAFSDAGF
jgi:hypothetical protein